ncbi:MAG: OmpA family protein [Pseudomonadota bacterium]
MKLRTATLAAILAAALTPAAPGLSLAEEMSAEDILKRLQAQRTRTLGFVDASKPAGEAAQEETSIAAAPEAPSAPEVQAPSGLALAPITGGGNGAGGLSVGNGGDGTAAGGAPQLASTGVGETAPTLDTTITGLQPVAPGGSAPTALASGGDGTAGGTQVPTLTAAASPGAAPALQGTEPSAEDLVINLTIYFDFDSAVLQPASKRQLAALCQAIVSDTGDGTYKIIGHTDAKGNANYNKRLSQARADEVVRYMTKSCGIDGARLEAVGAGEEQLKLPNDPRNGENRRVEVQVLS